LTKIGKVDIIEIGNEHTEMYVATYRVQHYIAVPKQNVVLLFYSLLDHFMYKTVNKVTFMTREIPSAYIKNNINFINTTSLSDCKQS